jgi:hypothetical protein
MLSNTGIISASKTFKTVGKNYNKSWVWLKISPIRSITIHFDGIDGAKFHTDYGLTICFLSD